MICHHGPSIIQAHNISIIKHNNKWIKCNDMSISIERWPLDGKDFYIIVVEKKKVVTNKNVRYNDRRPTIVAGLLLLLLFYKVK